MSWTRRDSWMLLVVLLLAALMRFTQLGIIEFKHDEAYLSLIALDSLAAGAFPLLGMPSSVGIPNAPASVWLMMLPYAFTNNPLIATGFVALLNVLGVGLLFLLVRRLFNRQTALIAALLYAVNPYAVFYSRKIWAQEMHTPFLLLALWFGIMGFIDGKRVFQILCLPILLFALQMHYAAWTLLPLYILLLWAGRKNIVWGALTLSVILAALVMLPFGLGIWQTWQDNPNLLARESSGFSPALDVLIYHGRLLSGAGFAGEMLDTFPEWSSWFYNMWWVILMIAGIIGIVAILRNQTDGKNAVPTDIPFVGTRYIASVILFIWLIIPITVFSLGWTNTFPHYFITSLPALCTIAAIGVLWLSVRVNRFAVFGIIGIVMLTQSVAWFYTLNTANAQSGSFGIPLHYRLGVRITLQSHDNMLLISDGYRTRYDEEAAAWAVMLHGDACLRVISTDSFTVIPQGEFVTLTEPDSPSRFYYETDDPQPLPAGYTLHIHETLEPDPLPQISPMSFDNGVRITGLALEGNILRLEWDMPPSQPGRDYQYFAHFIDANGEKIGQRDGEFLPGRWWCEGDTLITQIDVDAPPETASIRVGMYQLTPDGGFINASVVDETGTSTGIWGTVPLD